MPILLWPRTVSNRIMDRHAVLQWKQWLRTQRCICELRPCLEAHFPRNEYSRLLHNRAWGQHTKWFVFVQLLEHHISNVKKAKLEPVNSLLEYTLEEPVCRNAQGKVNLLDVDYSSVSSAAIYRKLHMKAALHYSSSSTCRVSTSSTLLKTMFKTRRAL